MPLIKKWSQSLYRQPDSEVFYLACTGGIRCAKHDVDLWHIEPIFDGRSAIARGLMSGSQLRLFLDGNGIRPIAMHRMGWDRGQYNSGWSPIIPERAFNIQSAADLWSNIEYNLCKSRLGSMPDTSTEVDPAERAKIWDDMTEFERLARCISLSLRNMDIAVERTAQSYNAYLVNLMATGNLHGGRSGSYQDVALYAHVHSFFTHLGSARDYLAALIASRLGKKDRIDAMGRLVPELRATDLLSDELLGILQARGCLQIKANSSDKIKAAGWLEEVKVLRDQFVHRRPYGSKSLERSGYAEPIDESAGLYRYVRPFMQVDGSETDILDLIARHYAVASSLFLECAEKSGPSTEMITLTDSDIISIDVNNDSPN